MALYPVNQKKVGMKQKNKESAPKQKTPPVKVNPISFPTVDGDLGIFKIKMQEIPKQTRNGPMKNGDSATNHISGSDQKLFTKIMKHQGMI